MNSARELLLEKAREVDPRPGALALHLGVPHGPVHGWCEGCLRTLDEIAAWGMASDAQKRASLGTLLARRAQDHEAHHLRLRLHLALRLPRVREAAAGAQGPELRSRYRPVLFAGLLKHHGQLGPAEIAPKRDWTYRQVLWLAHAHGIPLQMPAAHPFNPLALLRLALACGQDGRANRYVAETVFATCGAAAPSRGRAAPGRAATATAAAARSGQRAGEGRTEGQHRCRHRPRPVRRADLRSRRQVVLGLRRIAHAARVPGRKWLVRHGRLGKSGLSPGWGTNP